MQQQPFAKVPLEPYRMPTGRERFRDEMAGVILWGELRESSRRSITRPRGLGVCWWAWTRCSAPISCNFGSTCPSGGEAPL
jgi:hypothetical protein